MERRFVRSDDTGTKASKCMIEELYDAGAYAGSRSVAIPRAPLLLLLLLLGCSCFDTILRAQLKYQITDAYLS